MEDSVKQDLLRHVASDTAGTPTSQEWFAFTVIYSENGSRLKEAHLLHSSVQSFSFPAASNIPSFYLSPSFQIPCPHTPSWIPSAHQDLIIKMGQSLHLHISPLAVTSPTLKISMPFLLKIFTMQVLQEGSCSWCQIAASAFWMTSSMRWYHGWILVWTIMSSKASSPSMTRRTPYTACARGQRSESHWKRMAWVPTSVSTL